MHLPLTPNSKPKTPNSLLRYFEFFSQLFQPPRPHTGYQVQIRQGVQVSPVLNESLYLPRQGRPNSAYALKILRFTLIQVHGDAPHPTFPLSHGPDPPAGRTFVKNPCPGRTKTGTDGIRYQTHLRNGRIYARSLGKNLQGSTFLSRGIYEAAFRRPYLLNLSHIRINGPCQAGFYLPRGENKEKKEEGVSSLTRGPFHGNWCARSLPEVTTGRTNDLATERVKGRYTLELIESVIVRSDGVKFLDFGSDYSMLWITPCSDTVLGYDISRQVASSSRRTTS